VTTAHAKSYVKSDIVMYAVFRTSESLFSLSMFSTFFETYWCHLRIYFYIKSKV